MRLASVTIFSLLGVVFSLSACGPDPGEKQRKENEKILADLRKRNQQIMEEFRSRNSPDWKDYLEKIACREGLEPGDIFLAGAMVRGASPRNELDSRFDVSMIPGKYRSRKPSSQSEGLPEGQSTTNGPQQTSRTAANHRQPVLLPFANEPEIQSANLLETNYSLGCDNAEARRMSAKQIEFNSAQVSGETPLVISGKTLIVCGSPYVPGDKITLLADHMILKNVDIRFLGRSSAPLSLKANRLTLSGRNNISLRGSDRALAVPLAPALTVSVRAEIAGTGTLSLSTIGGDCVADSGPTIANSISNEMAP